MSVTSAHQAEVTIRFIERWPAHEPREKDPHYHLFHQAKERMRKAGLLKCNVESDYHYGQIELHHDKVEFAHIGDIDLEKFNKAYGLDLTDEAFQEYVEQEGNLEPLCVPGDAPVLTTRGQIPIAQLRLRDRVIGPDARLHRVQALLARGYLGPLVCLDGAWMTPEHPVLTPRGWLPAGSVGVGDQVGQYVRVLGDQMRDVVAVEPQVLRAIVRSDVVDVVNPLAAVKGPAELLFHDETVLEGLPPAAAFPHKAADVSLRRLATSEEDAVRSGASPGHLLERDHAAVIGAEPLVSRTLDRSAHSHSTLLADDVHGVGSRGNFAPRRRTLPRAGRVARGVIGRNGERRAACDACLVSTPAGFAAAWCPVDHVEGRMFSGRVYDITVAGCPAFISGGLILHNCTLHHRGQEGVHSLPTPEWNVLRTSTDPRHVITALANSEIGVVGPT